MPSRISCYSDRYFEGGVSSVYLWDLDDGGFAGVVVLKKGLSRLLLRSLLVIHTHPIAPVLSPNNSEAPSGAWDSIHVFEASERGRHAHYKLTSTIMLHLTTQSRINSESEKDKKNGGVESKGEGSITLSGSMTRQVSTCIYLPIFSDISSTIDIFRALL